MTTQPTKKKIVFKIKHLAAITQDICINAKSYITNPNDIVEMATTNQKLIDDIGRQLNELKNELEMDAHTDDDGVHICGDCKKNISFCRTIDSIDYCLKCAVKYENSDDDDDDIHICGETGKQYDTDPNPKLGCGIRCDVDETGMIGNISYCIGCMEK